MIRFRRRRMIIASLVIFGCLLIYHRGSFNMKTVTDPQRIYTRHLKASRNDQSGFVTHHKKTDEKVVERTPTPVLPKEIQNNNKELRKSLNINKSVQEPILTLCTTWTDETSRYAVHNLTIRNWILLRPYVIPVVFTNDSTVAYKIKQHGLDVLPIRMAAAGGIPILKYMFQNIMSTYNTAFYGYTNSDILFTDTLLETLAWIMNSTHVLENPLMIIGKRTNVQPVREKDTTSWKRLYKVATGRGKLFTGLAEDYFITSRIYPWKETPNLVVGRPAYDNWLVYHARKQNHTVIDATNTILAVHQTTIAGNDEGRGRNYSSYNHDLLVKLDSEINYLTGVVDCANFKTVYDKKSVVVVSRKVPRYCKMD